MPSTQRTSTQPMRARSFAGMLAAVLALVGALVALAAGTASAVELRDAELVAGGSPVLQNGSGTVRLDDARLGRLGKRVLVPEPGALWQLGAGIALLALLAGRRRRRTACDTGRRSAWSRRSHHSEKGDTVMKKHFRSRAPWLAFLALTLLAAPAFAQVPQDTTFTGRLVDDLGDPLAGPVNLTLSIFDVDTGGTPLYSEQHLGVPLDATGGFSVQLGQGTSPSGTFDADLFSGVNRWLAVRVNGQVLGPRQIIGSVPWALVAQQANEIVPDPNAARFENCGGGSDGTVVDHQTGLQWEQKIGAVDTPVDCGAVDCPDPHDVNNQYQWTVTFTDPDGGAFTDFLAKLNDPVFGEAATESDVTGCFAGHCDWRLPNIVELQTIVDCAHSPCIDPIFGPLGLPSYWSASTLAGNSDVAWRLRVDLGEVALNSKFVYHNVRAVRVGSCH